MRSGTHARAYLHLSPQGTLVQLPLGWYSEKGGHWAMSPGYDTPQHPEAQRPIGYDCMFCHNAQTGDKAGAIAHLKLAADAEDENVRQIAAQALTQLGVR